MIPSDPLYAQQWHFDHLGDIETIWDEYYGAGVTVGIYDSGVKLDHPDLAANYDPSLRIIIDGSPLPGEPNTTTPDAHGTFVAGLIAAGANNGLGGVGVAWGADFASVDILDPSSPVYVNLADFTDLASAVNQMKDFDVTNNSWNASLSNYDVGYSIASGGGYLTFDNEYANASQFGRGSLGTVIVQAVGNSNVDSQHSGVNASRFTISVAGIQEDGFAASFSNYGACHLVTAPAVNMVTTHIAGVLGNPDDYVDAADNAAFPPDGLYGTSYATPIVSGIVALMLDANAGLGWRDVQNIIAASARHTGSDSGDLGAEAAHANENGEWFFNDAANWNGGGMHFSNDYGYGAVDAYAAVRIAEVWSLFTTAQTTANERNWFNTNATGWSIAASGTATADVSIAPTPFTIDVEHGDVEITLTHSDFTKLRIFLVAPSGTEVELFDGSGGTNTTADSGLTWIYGVDALRGEDATGTWTVRVENESNTDIGTLNSVKVTAYGQGGSIDDVYHYTDEFLAMKALEAGRAALADVNGGTDWIDAAAVTGNVALNLNAGAVTKVGATNWFTIAAGTTIERAVTGDGNDTLTGNGVANRLHGMRGNDTLDGGLGNDNMFGGKGSDTYTIAQSGDVADETGGNGTDTVKASITFSLSDTVHAKGAIEHLTLTGVGAINATGNGGVNTLTGNGAANTLDGLGSNDTMRGMGGNDTYVVGQSGDVADETGSNGVDLVKSVISFSLANTTRAKGNIENLPLTGSAKIDATGNALANILVGNSGANVVNGVGGNDRMTGGANADTFAFDTALNAATNVDHVTDFLSGIDTLRLDASVFAKLKVGALSKKAFFAKKGAEKAKDKQDRVIYDTDSGEVRFDKDGKGKTKAVLVAVLDGSPDLAHTDVLVVA